MSYTDDQIGENRFVRTFSLKKSESELEWHRDDHARTVTVISGRGWKFQREDHLPVDLTPGDIVKIKKHEWHRIMTGDTGLVLEIQDEID